MQDIILTPEELMAQSAEMASLQTEYDSLFAQVTNALHVMNDYWSPNLASNFEGKISGAQKTFANITNMLANGSGAARLSAATFSGNLNSYLSALMGDESGDMSSLILELGDKSALWAAKLIGQGATYETVRDAVEKIQNGDYEGALRIVGAQGADWLAGAMTGSMPESEWVNKLDEMTGGAIGLVGLEKQYFKNWIGTAFNDAIDAYKLMDTDPQACVHKIGEAAWNFSAGAPLKTAGDAAWNVAKKIPGIGSWYEERGATDSESALGVGLSEMMYAITGNQEDADYVKNYYSDHGGIAGGIVDGIVDIAQYAYEKVSQFPWKSVIC